MGSSWWGMEGNRANGLEGDVRLGAGYRVGITLVGRTQALVKHTTVYGEGQVYINSRVEEAACAV